MDEQLITTVASRPEATPDTFRGDPTRKRTEIATVESTNELQDFVDAIKHTRPNDIRLQSSIIDESDNGPRLRDPSWEPIENNVELVELDSEWTYTDGMIRLDALQVVALEEGIIDEVTAYPVGADFHRAIKALRKRGAPIPKYEWKRSLNKQADLEPIPVLPPEDEWNTTSDPDVTNSTESDLTIEEARNRCQAAICGATRQRATLVVALPTLGKSYGTVLVAAATGKPITLITCRGHKEQYKQFEEWCTKHELTHRRLPSFFRACPTAPTGLPETSIEEQVRDLYRREANPQAIHERAVEVFGTPLPCQQNGECPYMSAWDFDPGEYDVLLGYYTHAHVRPAIDDRTVVVDEFPGNAFETVLDSSLSAAVTHFLQSYQELPFENYTDLVEDRDDRERRETALEWFEAPDDSYTGAIFEDDEAHAMAPLATYTLLTSKDLGNGWERAWPLGRDEHRFARVGLFDRDEGTIYLLRPPDFTPARNVVALDGTPTPAMWNLALGIELEESHVLSQAEKQAYIQDVLQHKYIRTTEYPKSYNGNGVTPQKDSALLTGIIERHDAKPGLLTTKTAENIYEKKGHLDLVCGYRHYGDLIGSNDFEENRLGVVIGSNHYGDKFIEKWSAYAGTAAEREGSGNKLTYGVIGDKVYQHMTAHDTLQAVMRFGRDGEGATVYVHTNTLPDWVPIANEGRLIEAWSLGAKQVIEVAAEMESWRTADLAEHPEIEVGGRQIRNILTDLTDQGFVERSQEGRGYLWQNVGLENAIDDSTIATEGVPEMEPTSIYRWDFRNTE